MTIKQILYLCLICGLLFSARAYSQEKRIEMHRISESVIVVSAVDQTPFMGYINSIALSTENGIVVIDTWPAGMADTLKQIIKSTFSDNKITYIINTNTSLDHLGGNSKYPEATLVAHKNYAKGVQDAIQQAKGYWDMMIPMLEKKLESLDENSDGANSARQFMKLMQEARDDFNKNFRYAPPDITFSDRITLHCGELTLQIISIGSAFTNADIVVYIPEEKLLLSGNAFTLLIPPEIFPNPNSSYERWISVLTELIDSENSIDYIVPTNLRYNYMKKDDLNFICDYYSQLWQGIKKAKSEGIPIEKVQEEFSLDKMFAHNVYFKNALTAPRFQEWRDYFKWLKNQKIIQSDDIGEQMQILHSRNIATMWKYWDEREAGSTNE